MTYQGDFTTSNTVYVYFNTFDSNDPSASVIISDFVVGDIAIYKDGSITQRSSTAGFTLLDTDGINFDGVTGIHGFSVDLSDNTDAGFYATGSEFGIIVGPFTVDAATVNFVAATFSIERAGGALELIQNIQSRIPATLVSGLMSSDVTAVSTSTIAADNMEVAALSIEVGAAETGTLSVTQMTTNLAEITDNHYQNRSVIWTSGVLLKQSSKISAYLGSTGMLTYDEITEAPSNLDTFIIV